MTDSIDGEKRSILWHLRKYWILLKWKYFQFTRTTMTFPTQQGIMTVCTQDDVMAKLIYLFRHHQLDTVNRVLEFLRAKTRMPARGQGVILDIGANIGVISIGLLVQDEMVSAIGIEPEPTNLELCKLNISQNGLDKRYQLFPVAASDKAGTVQMELSNKNFGDHRVKMTNDGKSNTKTVSVETAPIDDILTRVPESTRNEIALIWMDVQGHEGYVFAGGPQLFKSGVPVVAEVWPYGIQYAGMTMERYLEIVTGYWSHYWVWEKPGQFVQYPITKLAELCKELERKKIHEDVIFMD